MATTYLGQLTERLAAGLACVEPIPRDRHAQFLLGAQRPDGGFAGREGESDLYYTSFALRALAALQVTPSPAERSVTVASPVSRHGVATGVEFAVGAARFLRERAQQPAAVVDFLALVYSAQLVQAAIGVDILAERRPDWRDRVADTLESFRSPEGGYCRSLPAGAASTYYTFLVALCYELIDRPLPDRDGVVEFLLTRRRDDGGFVEVAPARRSGANPTAAALTILRQHAVLDSRTRAAAADFLVGLQAAHGGFCANTRVPLADLLSSFTCLVTLQDIGADDRIRRDALAAFASGLALPTGGFRAGVWDSVADVEYTFYGLGVASLLAQPADPGRSP